MRVNHAGEIAAQALYHGQALMARDPKVRAGLLDAARDETDHLAWCQDRVRELGSRPSLLAPVWYAGSFTIGAITGLAGDRTSLGFVAETERQVDRAPRFAPARAARGCASELLRRIVERRCRRTRRGTARMRAAHARAAELPDAPIRELMRLDRPDHEPAQCVLIGI